MLTLASISCSARTYAVSARIEDAFAGMLHADAVWAERQPKLNPGTGK